MCGRHAVLSRVQCMDNEQDKTMFKVLFGQATFARVFPPHPGATGAVQDLPTAPKGRRLSRILVSPLSKVPPETSVKKIIVQYLDLAYTPVSCGAHGS